MVFIDPTGDTTYYYSKNGDYMGVTYDKLENGVSVISDVKGWTKSVLGHAQALANGKVKSDLNDYAREQRGFGDTYMVDDLGSFYDNAQVDAIEHGTYLYENEDGEIRHGKENFFGTFEDVRFGQNNHGGNGSMNDNEKPLYSTVSMGSETTKRRTNMHTHHCLSDPLAGTSQAYPSPDPDMVNSPVKGLPSVVVSKKRIYIYSKQFGTIGFQRSTFKPIKTER